MRARTERRGFVRRKKERRLFGQRLRDWKAKERGEITCRRIASATDPRLDNKT